MNTPLSIFNFINDRIDQIGKKIEGKTVKIYTDIAGPLLFIIFAIVILLLTPSQIEINGDEKISARTFPSMMMVIIIIFSSLLLIKETVRLLMKKECACIKLNLLTEVRMLILLAIMICYALLMPLVGFAASSIIFSFLMLFYFRVKKVSWYLITAGVAVFVTVLFRYILNVRLP